MNQPESAAAGNERGVQIVNAPIPFYDFGGRGPLLHFAHSNGFTPACFRQMMEPLLPHFHVLAVCHRPLWPGSQPEEMRDWNVVADDMLRFFDERGIEEVIGVGHSLGAVATMYAAVKRPSLFRKLVLIEPIFLPPPILQVVEANPDFMNTFPLVRNTRARRNH